MLHAAVWRSDRQRRHRIFSAQLVSICRLVLTLPTLVCLFCRDFCVFLVLRGVTLNLQRYGALRQAVQSVANRASHEEQGRTRLAPIRFVDVCLVLRPDGHGIQGE